MKRERGRAFWERLAREVEGGASRVEVAKRHGVSVGWLGKWCRRLERDSGSKATLLPVRVVSSSRRIELRVGDIRLSFEEGTDPGYVAALARELLP